MSVLECSKNIYVCSALACVLNSPKSFGAVSRIPDHELSVRSSKLLKICSVCACVCVNVVYVCIINLLKSFKCTRRCVMEPRVSVLERLKNICVCACASECPCASISVYLNSPKSFKCTRRCVMESRSRTVSVLSSSV